MMIPKNFILCQDSWNILKDEFSFFSVHCDLVTLNYIIYGNLEGHQCKIVMNTKETPESIKQKINDCYNKLVGG